MRSISTNGLAMLAQRLGNEPIMIVEVDWRDGVQPKQYADREVTLADGTVIPGAIVQISDLDDAIDVTTWNNSSKQIEVTLDDTDGSIKNLFDRYDITKRTVRVYQWFTGLDWSDRFVAFVGLINSPVSWNERDRTFKITVLSQIEDLECGFSAEEGQLFLHPCRFGGQGVAAGLRPGLRLSGAVPGGGGRRHLAATDRLCERVQREHCPLRQRQQRGRQEAVAACHGDATRGFPAGVAMCWASVDSQKSRGLHAAGPEDLRRDRPTDCRDWHAEACAQQTRTQQYDRALCTVARQWSQSGAGPRRRRFPAERDHTLNVKGATVTGYFKGEYFYIESRGNNPQADIELANKWYNEWLDYYLKKELTACTPMRDRAAYAITRPWSLAMRRAAMIRLRSSASRRWTTLP